MKNHITDGSPCWCNPEMTYKDPINGAEVYVHKELQMSNEEIIKAVKNSLNIYSFTAEALEMMIDNVKKEATIRTKDLTDDEIADTLEKTLVVEDERFEFQGGRILTIRESELLPTARAVIAADREKNK